MKTTGELKDHWLAEIEDAPRETVERLRYAFPNLDERALLRMAERHPEVEATRRHCRAELAKL